MKPRKITKSTEEPAKPAAPEIRAPRVAFTLQVDPVQHRLGALLMREAIERQAPVEDIVSFEMAVAYHTGNYSKLCGVLDALLAIVKGLRDVGAVQVQAENPIVQNLYEVGIHRQRTMLPWIENKDGLEALAAFIKVAEVGSKRVKCSFTGHW